MSIRYPLFFMQILGVLVIIASGCSRDIGGPKELVDRYFSSAVSQDYATTYDCYYDAYKAKITKDEFIKHRREASTLQSYKILSLTRQGDTAEAEVQLTFAPSEKLNRSTAVSTKVKENLVRENGDWKVKVWD